MTVSPYAEVKYLIYHIEQSSGCFILKYLVVKF